MFHEYFSNYHKNKNQILNYYCITINLINFLKYKFKMIIDLKIDF